MEWNAEGQLKRVSLNGNEVARFSYDPMARRVEKIAIGVTTTYTYDGEDILRETRGSSTLRYVHGTGSDEALALDDGTALTYFHSDALGSIAKTTDSGGAVVSARQYDAWGNLQARVDQPGYAFTGREWDPEIGLYYYRARYYDPRYGRFISEDPASAVEPYSYVGGNPVRFVDPAGLWRTTGKPAPKKANTLICDGAGGIAIQVTDVGTPAQAKCLESCMREHEESHKRNVLISQPNVCVGVKKGIQLEYSSRNEENIEELGAYNDEIKCLEGKKGDCKCDQIIDDRIIQLRQLLKKYVDL
jgi:RHS repeat-associated protein